MWSALTIIVIFIALAVILTEGRITITIRHKYPKKEEEATKDVGNRVPEDL